MVADRKQAMRKAEAVLQKDRLLGDLWPVLRQDLLIQNLMYCRALQDEEYSAAGAKLVGAKEAFGSDIVLKVRPPKIGDETSMFKSGAG